MPHAAPSGTAPAGCSAHRATLGDVVRRYGEAFAAAQPLSPAQRKAMQAIARCRTAALGGHRDWCPRCGYERFVYHSCRNRHCPQCQSLATAAWTAARTAELLPVPYFHNVFTLPHELNPLIRFSERNTRALLKLLFDAAARTLLAFGEGELGGKIGFTLVLHTWDQQLRTHVHLHALIASGALADKGRRWVAGGRKFLFLVRGLSKMFRAKFLEGLAALLAAGRLDLPPQLVQLAEQPARRVWLKALRKKPWVVYSQRPFAGPKKLVDYLGRYVHKTAIGNHRILSCRGGRVRFTWRDRRDGDRRKVLCLGAEEFLRRFLSHVLPDGFQRVRHYGLFANRGKRQRLAKIRALLGAAPPPKEEPSRTAAEWMSQLLGLDIHQCPVCRGPLCATPLPPDDGLRQLAHAPGFDPWDTS